MAHLFKDLGNKTTFVSKKEIPWHGLGKIVDAMTSEEAIKLGGMDFEVAKVPLYYTNQNSIPFDEGRGVSELARFKNDANNPTYHELKLVPDAFTMIRTDTQHSFGYVGKRYEPIQNQEAFNFFDSIIGEGHAQYETVGALGNGEVVFITAKLPDYFEIAKDRIDKYLLLTMSHDGSSAITIMFTPIRVVCNNTLSMALQGAKNGRNKVTIKHTKNARDRMELAKVVLDLIDNQNYINRSTWSTWSNETVSDKIALDLLEAAFGIVRDEKNKLSTRASNMLTSINNYYHGGVGQSNIVGTKWGVYNAVTGYLQNVKDYKTADKKFTDTFLSGDSNIRDKISNLLMTT